jgi:hypothetical protein
MDCNTATGKEYGLLAKIIGKPKYTHLTNLIWVQEFELANFNPTLTAATAIHKRKRMEEEWEEKHMLWYIHKGFLRDIAMNMHDALDKQYYSQLKHINTIYCNTTPLQILDHLDT